VSHEAPQGPADENQKFILRTIAAGAFAGFLARYPVSETHPGPGGISRLRFDCSFCILIAAGPERGPELGQTEQCVELA
jgi:hypothetical protein